MDEQPVSLKLLFWVEIVVAVRILLFVLPVLINRMMTRELFVVIDDCFMVFFTISCVFYVVAGVASVLGARLWRFLQYAVILLTSLGAAAFLKTAARQGMAVESYHYLPLLISSVFFLFLLIGGSRRAAA